MTTAATIGTREVSGPADGARMRAWSAAYVGSGVADAVWIPEEVTAFRGRLRRRMVQDVVVVDVESDPFGARWTSSSPAAGYVGVSVKTRMFAERVVLGDQREFVSTTSMDVWDAAVLVEAESLDPVAQTMLLVPKSALHMSSSCSLRQEDVLREADAGLLAVLRSVVLAVAANADRFDAAAAAAARGAVVDLLLGVVRDRRQPSGAAVSEAMRLAVCRWVEENLATGNLSAERAAEAHSISVRSLHRLFGDSGDSFQSLVRRRRLDRAGRDLLQTDDAVQAIAMRWGYSDASHFTNAFKRAHGSTPLAYRRAHRTP
ncbi:helix-turn-helix transcriptional regulator [Blastococcus sp. SYSU D00695]